MNQTVEPTPSAYRARLRALVAKAAPLSHTASAASPRTSRPSCLDLGLVDERGYLTLAQLPEEYAGLRAADVEGGLQLVGALFRLRLRAMCSDDRATTSLYRSPFAAAWEDQ